jgi:hypothetical protein
MSITRRRLLVRRRLIWKLKRRGGLVHGLDMTMKRRQLAVMKAQKKQGDTPSAEADMVRAPRVDGGVGVCIALPTHRPTDPRSSLACARSPPRTSGLTVTVVTLTSLSPTLLQPHTKGA